MRQLSPMSSGQIWKLEWNSIFFTNLLIISSQTKYHKSLNLKCLIYKREMVILILHSCDHRK